MRNIYETLVLEFCTKWLVLFHYPYFNKSHGKIPENWKKKFEGFYIVNTKNSVVTFLTDNNVHEDGVTTQISKPQMNVNDLQEETTINLKSNEHQSIWQHVKYKQ